MAKIYGDRWRLVRDLGQGGQAIVCLVEDQRGELPGQYALKRIRGDGSPKAIQRLRREVDALKSIDHPGVVRLVDHSLLEDIHQFYVMEYVDGSRPLSKLLSSDSNPFRGSPVLALKFAIDILSALDCCHRQGILHRDLSPSNILIVSGNMQPRLIDFGLCQIEDGTMVTLLDEGVGTQNYMAPECEAGAEGVVGPASDIYSVGKLLWAVICNQNAFSREALAFQGKKMSLMLPNNEAAWHLHHVFAATIRHEPTKRARDASAAIEICRSVLRLIEAGYPPLERLASATCPYCGFGTMQQFDGSHMVFGNPNPSGIASVQCDNCGYSAPVNFALAHANLKRRGELT